MDMKRFFLYFIAIAALALAGCGGNGGTAMGPDDDDDDDDVMQCPSGTTGTYPDCTPIPAPRTNDSFPGTDMEAAMAIFLPTRTGDAGDLNDARRPSTPVAVVAAGDHGTTTIDGDVLNKDDDGIKDDEEFMRDGDAVRAVLDDFPNVMVQSRTIEDETDTVTIYSDVKARSDRKYLEYFADANANATGRPETRPAVITAMATGANDNGILTIGDGSDGYAVPAANAALFSSSAFPTEEDQEFTYVNDVPGTTENEEKRGGRTLEGTFSGVSGRFICTGTTCSAGNNAKGVLSSLTGTWTFVPDDVRGYVRNVIPDLDYLSFGYWLHTDEDGDYSVNAFFAGSQEFTGADDTFAETDISGLIGNATYSGEATGFYVKKTFDAGANDFAPTSSGQFTASANLTARFGGTEFGTDSDFEIDGYVMDFRNGDGDVIDSNWKVELMDAPFFDGSTYTTTFSGTTSTGTGSTPGQWNGQFFGNPRNADGTATANNADTLLAEDAPTGVGGEFNAHFSPGGGQDPGHVIGAFGAKR